MAQKGEVWKNAQGKFGISHTGLEPTEYPYDTKEDAEAVAESIYTKATSVEQSCAGGTLAGATAPHLNR